jgi:hypothetical protein
MSTEVIDRLLAMMVHIVRRREKRIQCIAEHSRDRAIVEGRAVFSDCFISRNNFATTTVSKDYNKRASIPDHRTAS